MIIIPKAQDLRLTVEDIIVKEDKLITKEELRPETDFIISDDLKCKFILVNESAYMKELRFYLI